MSKKKLFFENEDAEICFNEEHFKDVMKADKLTEMKVLEAVKANDPDHIWCRAVGEAGEKGECGKQCDAYEPRNGKSGCCKHLGTLYNWGEQVILTL